MDTAVVGGPPAQAEQRVMPFITFGLLRGIVSICLESGLSHITAVMKPPLIRLLKRFGLDFHSIGGLVEHHGLRQPCVARLFDLIGQVRDERSALWLYARDEVSRHTDLDAPEANRYAKSKAAALPIDD